ncbi:MAG: hypothetical protein ABL949_01070 [Fimbriimonadaceae bacterium]
MLGPSPAGKMRLEFTTMAPGELDVETVGIAWSGVVWYQVYFEPASRAYSGMAEAYQGIVDLGETEVLARIEPAVATWHKSWPADYSPLFSVRPYKLRHFRVETDNEQCFEFVCEGFEVLGDL